MQRGSDAPFSPRRERDLSIHRVIPESFCSQPSAATFEAEFIGQSSPRWARMNHVSAKEFNALLFVVQVDVDLEFHNQ